MKQVWFARYDAQGRYWFTGSCAEGAPDLKDADVYVGRVDPKTQYHDLATNRPVDMPPRPTREHTFDYVSKTWRLDLTAAWARVRMQRNARLQSTDWTQLADVPESTRRMWQEYRQALRDVTKQPDPLAIVWPKPPQL